MLVAAVRTSPATAGEAAPGSEAMVPAEFSADAVDGASGARVPGAAAEGTDGNAEGFTAGRAGAVADPATATAGAPEAGASPAGVAGPEAAADCAGAERPAPGRAGAPGGAEASTAESSAAEAAPAAGVTLAVADAGTGCAPTGDGATLAAAAAPAPAVATVAAGTTAAATTETDPATTDPAAAAAAAAMPDDPASPESAVTTVRACPVVTACVPPVEPSGAPFASRAVVAGATHAASCVAAWRGVDPTGEPAELVAPSEGSRGASFAAGFRLSPPDGVGSVAPLRNWSKAAPFAEFEREAGLLCAEAGGGRWVR